MKVLAWVFVGLVAAGCTYITCTTDDDELVIIAGLLGALSWMLFAWFSLSITIYDQTGTAHTDRYPAMAAFGLMWAVPNLYFAYYGPLSMVKNRSKAREEVQ